MANGKTAHEHIGAVKSTIYGLEVSPSCHSATSPIAHGGSSALGKSHGRTHATGTLSHTGKGHTRGKPRGTKIDVGKKHMMHQKSHGR